MYDKKKEHKGGLFFFNIQSKKFSKILGKLNTPNGPCFDKKKINHYSLFINYEIFPKRA